MSNARQLGLTDSPRGGPGTVRRIPLPQGVGAIAIRRQPLRSAKLIAQHAFASTGKDGEELMNPWANVEVLHHRGNYLVRRQRLSPGEATPWHRDPFHRVTVVLSGDLLNIEFRDGGKTQPWKITARRSGLVAAKRPRPPCGECGARSIRGGSNLFSGSFRRGAAA
jgi:hypothetical protein